MSADNSLAHCGAHIQARCAQSRRFLGLRLRRPDRASDRRWPSDAFAGHLADTVSRASQRAGNRALPTARSRSRTIGPVAASFWSWKACSTRPRSSSTTAPVARHGDGWTPIEVDLTDALDGKRTFVLGVDAPRPRRPQRRRRTPQPVADRQAGLVRRSWAGFGSRLASRRATPSTSLKPRCERRSTSRRAS